MNGGSPSWLFPAAIVGYVTLAVLTSLSSPARFLLLGLPVSLAFSFRWVEAQHRSGKLLGPASASRAVLFGLTLAFVCFFGPADAPGLQAATGLALLSATAGALLFIARVDPAPGLLKGHPAASSLDAFVFALVVWSLTTTAAFARTLFPQYVALDPVAFDTALIFSVLGSLLLFIVTEIRVLILRGLELGVADRSRASLALAIAGTLIAVGAALVDVAPADRVASATLVMTALGISVTKLLPRASHVTRSVRALLAALLLGAPIALVGAHFSIIYREHPASVVLLACGFSLIAGWITRSLAEPLGPEGSRWLRTAERAMDAALEPEPDVALREVLLTLRRAEPVSETRPEVFRLDPPALLSVDVAGYLSTREVDFPRGMLEYALGEPELTLRRETVERAQVRDPKVRPLVSWFAANEAKTATALTDDEGGVGLLILPAGKRKSPLSLEEAEALGRLGRRLAGLLSVNAALARARKRELDVRFEAELAVTDARSLREQLEGTQRAHEEDVESLYEVLRVAGHSPSSRLCMQELDDLRGARHIELLTPPGVDPRPWAAHFHRQQEDAKVLAVFDGTQKGARNLEFYQEHMHRQGGVLKRQAGDSLLLLHLGALPQEAQRALAELLSVTEARLITSRDPAIPLEPSLERVLRGATLRLPSLAERAEDMNALILFELVRIGLAQRGRPLGMARSAFLALHERPFPGNEDELRGLLSAAVARSSSDQITSVDLEPLELASSPLPHEPPPAETPRSRSRRPPRSRLR